MSFFIVDVVREVRRARAMWPGNDHKLAALTEEVGELTKALLHHDYEVDKPDATPEAIWREAVQVAAMAVRVATEGDSTFGYRPPETRRMLKGWVAPKGLTA